MNIGEVMAEMQRMDAEITAEVHKGTKRDKARLRLLQDKHSQLSRTLAALQKPDRESPLDPRDTSGLEFRKQKVKRGDDNPTILNNMTPDAPTPLSKPKKETKKKSKAEKAGLLEAYCQKCKSKRIMVNPVIAKTKGGKNGAKGKCVECSSNMFRLVKN